MLHSQWCQFVSVFFSKKQKYVSATRQKYSVFPHGMETGFLVFHGVVSKAMKRVNENLSLTSRFKTVNLFKNCSNIDIFLFPTGRQDKYRAQHTGWHVELHVSRSVPRYISRASIRQCRKCKAKNEGKTVSNDYFSNGKALRTWTEAASVAEVAAVSRELSALLSIRRTDK